MSHIMSKSERNAEKVVRVVVVNTKNIDTYTEHWYSYRQ